MANVQLLIKVTGAGVPEAVELIKKVGGQVQAGLRGTGHDLQLKFQVCCERCGEPMLLRGKTLTCDSCLEEEARERALAYAEEAGLLRLPAPGPLEPVECEMF
jgi:hypothetical protein